MTVTGNRVWKRAVFYLRREERVVNLYSWEWLQKGKAHETHYIVVVIRMLFPNEDKLLVSLYY
jgi:hypothetical protein